MKKLVLATCVLLAASPAFACKYVQLQPRTALSAEKRAELAKDQQQINNLRQDMSSVCKTTKAAPINSCHIDNGMCADLPYELQSKFQYDVGADGSLKGMVSPEDRTKNAAIIDGLYKKWGAL
ncbi:MAG: hypothetical protein J0M34_01905 [Alphaproteobacteria bacterium]|nr:hypothetical protein [Alphaproteobacteria bacterium]